MADGGGDQLITPCEALDDVLGIAAENLVAAFTREHHLHAARGFARQHVDRDVGRFGHRRIPKPDQPWEPVYDVAVSDLELVVLGTEMPRHLGRVAELAVAIVAEPDREGFD